MVLRAPSERLDPELISGLFVGVEHYQDSYIKRLYNCKEDAEALYGIFNALSEKSERCTLLTDEKATRREILSSLVQHLNNASDGDFLIVYVSTHGIVDYNDYFFFPYDTELQNILGTGISASLLINGMGTLAQRKKVKVLMIFDTCYSGAIGFDYNKLNGEISCLFSSSATERSYERFDEEHGVFTAALLKGLQGCASDDKGIITLRSLFNFTYRTVQDNTHKRQNPILIGNMPDGTVIHMVQRVKRNSEKVQSKS